jgi:hypothetical protein
MDSALYLPLPNGTEARLLVIVRSGPSYPLDPDTYRRPSLEDMDAIAEALAARRWKFSPDPGLLAPDAPSAASPPPPAPLRPGQAGA